jgi:NAD(P)-dependent dehydrogenase (short-subunit alcohol dehydrogenase family)
MARIFITGSADGLGRMAAQSLIAEGHQVVLHARSRARAEQALAAVPGAETTVVGDLASLEQTRGVARQVNKLGRFDAVIHNAAIGYRESSRVETEDGLSQLSAINSLAPYVLTVLIERPGRLVYLSSGLHRSGDPTLSDLNWERRRWQGQQAYSDSKLHNALLAAAAARRWPDVLSNAVEPGWVATRMGGPTAPDDLSAGSQTQAWLAASQDPAACVSGRYFYHKAIRAPAEAVNDAAIQERLLEACARFAHLPFPD